MKHQSQSTYWLHITSLRSGLTHFNNGICKTIISKKLRINIVALIYIKNRYAGEYKIRSYLLCLIMPYNTEDKTIINDGINISNKNLTFIKGNISKSIENNNPSV